MVGFNDSEEGRLVRPPLTSVSLPFYDQGRQSAETLPAVLAGNDMPDSVTLESELLVRQSCGCPSWSERLAIAEFAAVSQSDPKSALKRTQKQLEAQIGKVIHNRGVAATWAKQLLDTFQSEIEGSGIGRFPEEL